MNHNLDAEVAGKVMGWVGIRACVESTSGYVGYSRNNPFPHDKGEEYVPNFSASIADAMTVLEKFESWTLSTSSISGSSGECERGVVCLIFVSGKQNGTWVGAAKTAPEAICLAALAAVQQERIAMSETWKATDQDLPPAGVVVDTISPGGIPQPLKRQGRLWLYPDGSGYVYYTPKFWRPI